MTCERKEKHSSELELIPAIPLPRKLARMARPRTSPLQPPSRIQMCCKANSAPLTTCDWYFSDYT